MTNTKTTKRSLFSSVVALLLCFTMLLGTTYAWFTDSVTSADNIIKSGTLDVTMHWADGTKAIPEGGSDDWKDASTGVIFNYDLWEPGYVEVRHIKIANVGSLALKYQLNIVANGEVTDLADVIDVYFIDGGDIVPNSDALDGKTPVGNLTNVLRGMPGNASGVLYPKDNADSFPSEAIVTIALKMREDAGNQYQDKKIGTNFSIQLLATQYTYEKDNFGNDYDELASYTDEAKTVAELVKALKENMNVTLAADIDLTGVEWTPIDSYSGTFDGAGHRISNLKGENGLFDNLSGATVKNLTLENVDIDATSNHTGALAGYVVKSQGKQTVIDNVTVSGTVDGGNYYVGGIIGADSNYDTVIKNCVNNATVTAPGQQVGGIVGYTTRGTLIENCTNEGNITGGSFVGGIVGMAAGDDEMPELSIIVKNSTNTGAITETATTPAVTWQGGVGGIIGNVGRAAGDSAVEMLYFYIIDCDVLDGQAVYGQKHNVASGNDALLTVYEGNTIAAGDAIAIQNVVKALAIDEDATFFLTDGNYNGDVNLTVAALGANKTGDIAFVAVPHTNPVITGTVTMGYRDQGVGNAMFNSNITFDGITFDHAEAEKHSIDVQDVKSLTLTNCKVIGDGEYGISSARGNGTGTSKIVGCTFENAGMQLLGNFATGLVIDDCVFNESCINVQAGNGVTVQNCEFNKTLTAANVDESFYAIRSNSTPITVKNCEINIDSELTEVATAQEKWGILWNRGTTNWTVENVEVTLTDTAQAQTELLVTKCTSTGTINTTNLTVNGVQQ